MKRRSNQRHGRQARQSARPHDDRDRAHKQVHATRNTQHSRRGNQAQDESKKLAKLTNALLSWFAANARDLPWRRTRDPYAIWVSEIMLQQTQVKTVIPYWERWMRALPDTSALSNASSERLHKLWEGLGYYARVRNMQKAAQVICREYGGCFPADFEQVLALPGIGRYTAGAICSIAFNQPKPVLDGNVMRVLTRVFGIRTDPRETKTNARLWKLAEALVQHAKRNTQHALACSHLNQSLMELGATICVPRNPACSECPIRRDCIAGMRCLTDLIPFRTTRPRSIEKKSTIVVAQRGGRYWAVQRTHGKLNGGLWEFPRLEELAPGISDWTQSDSERAKISTANPERLGTIKQTITRYRITLDVIRVQVDSGQWSARVAGRWLKARELDHIPFSAAHRKIATLARRKLWRRSGS